MVAIGNFAEGELEYSSSERSTFLGWCASGARFNSLAAFAFHSRLLLQVEILRGLAAPCLRDERLELSDGNRGQVYEDSGKTVVVRLGEELRGIQGKQRVLVVEVRDSDRDDVRLRHTGRSIQTQTKPFSLRLLRTEKAKWFRASSVSGNDRAIRRTSA